MVKYGVFFEIFQLFVEEFTQFVKSTLLPSPIIFLDYLLSAFVISKTLFCFSSFCFKLLKLLLLNCLHPSVYVILLSVFEQLIKGKCETGKPKSLSPNWKDALS